jgi:hypothetical protein
MSYVAQIFPLDASIIKTEKSVIQNVFHKQYVPDVAHLPHESHQRPTTDVTTSPIVRCTLLGCRENADDVA